MSPGRQTQRRRLWGYGVVRRWHGDIFVPTSFASLCFRGLLLAVFGLVVFAPFLAIFITTTLLSGHFWDPRLMRESVGRKHSEEPASLPLLSGLESVCWPYTGGVSCRAPRQHETFVLPSLGTKLDSDEGRQPRLYPNRTGVGREHDGCRHTPPRFIHHRTRRRIRRVGIKVGVGGVSVFTFRITLRFLTTVTMNCSVGKKLLLPPVSHSQASLLHCLFRESYIQRVPSQRVVHGRERT